MKKTFSFIITLSLFFGIMQAQELNKDVFKVIDLDHQGLQDVKKLHTAGDDLEAAKALLQYYRSKTSLVHPDIDLSNVKISKEEQKWADDGLKHIFFAHKGYQPSYHYGDDINWQYWPVKDNELRWQLHRTKWWQPMGKAYYISKDEKYAKEWAFQYMDWITKNPLIDKFVNEEHVGSNVDQLENSSFAWRPLEVSHRVQDQTIQFLLFLNSPNFTPELLSQFLVNYNKHANHIMAHYSERGNHLLFEAQRILYAGVCFPELKDANTWRKSGVDILNREVEVQVYDDGVQFELDLGYHLAAINIFAKAIRITDANGFKGVFPPSYYTTIANMIEVTMNTNYPDYTNPLFSDAKIGSKKVLLRNYKELSKIFPKNKNLRYFASDHKKGEVPSYLSRAFKTSGYYIFRNGWEENATQMIVKAGPPAFWHNQPDNGTFELYINGRNFFTDSGCYVYGGSEEVLKERAWFRQTMVHKTLTLDNKDLETTDSKCLLWDTKANQEVLVYENPSYSNLKHRRSVFFVDQKFFVIVDEAVGTAQGNVAIHYQLAEGDAKLDAKTNSATTLFTDNNNVVLKTFASNTTMVEEEGWVSYAYRKKVERPAFAFQVEKDNDKPIRFITVIAPTDSGISADKIKAQFADKNYSKDGLSVKVEVGNKKYNLKYKL